MILYILGQAESVPAHDDLPEEWRYLTQDEVWFVGRILKKMAGYCRMPRLVVSSPFVRSVQTSQIAALSSGRKCKVMVSSLFSTGGSPLELREVLLSHAKEKRVMVVGPQALLEPLVGNLLAEDEAGLLVNGGCLALEIGADEAERPARFLFYLAPGKKPMVSLKKALATLRLLADREPAPPVLAESEE